MNNLNQHRNELKPPAELDQSEPIPLRRQLGEPDIYPVDALGPCLSATVKRLAETIQAPIALCAQSVLAGANLAVQGHADVSLDGRKCPTSEFFLTIGESGERKFAVDRVVMQEFREHEKRLSVAYRSEKLSHENALAAYEKKRSEAKQGDDVKVDLDALGSPPQEPLLPLCLCDEPTFEGLCKLTESGQPSIGLFSDEGGRMIGGHGMTAENQMRTVTGLSKFWDGDPISRVRGGDGAKVLYGRRLSMHLMAQSVVVASLLTNEMILGQGILSRVLPAFPDSTTGTRLYRPIDLNQDPIIQSFHRRIREIIAVSPPLVEGTHNELQPRELCLSSAAKTIWMAFHDAIETQLGADGALAPIRGFAAKIPEHALRLAGTLTLFENLAATEISEGAIAGAIDLAQFYLGEALRLFHAAVVSPELIQAEQLLEWAKKQALKGQPYLYLPGVYQYGPNSIRDAKTARKLINILEQHGWIDPVPGGAMIDGKIRREVWKVRGNNVQAF
jgi:hypothetical protein